MSPGFKDQQLKFSRVAEAFDAKSENVEVLLAGKNLSLENLQIYLRAFKEERELELWARNADDSKFVLLKTYEVCKKSGTTGPKRRQGDLQVPEGFYHIDRFNPMSRFHLSLGINYPNKSDKILSDPDKPGGDIFIHGDCVTVGCLPITDDQIKELYVICVEAKDRGQEKIPVTIFPARLSEKKMQALSENYSLHPELIGLWTDLHEAYEAFNQSKRLPGIRFLDSGRHEIN
jgi:murein L,D-transpeptidase YafK